MRSARNPFDILPANLFNLFGTQGYGSLQRHYMAVLLRINALAEFNRHGLTREAVLASIAEYLQDEQAEADVAADMDAQDAASRAASREPITGQRATQDYAAYLLRRLAETGWIEREQAADYSETISLPDYAFSLLEAFRAIQEQKPREFKGQLYTAHQLLTSSRNKEFSPALALTQAYENVRQVVRGLNELNQNIRRYIERATRGRSVNELLRLQFDDYSQTLGPTYHALKTSDHVSRYRRDIVGKLQSWQRNAEWLDRAADDLAAHSRLTPAQASQEINRSIQFIIHQLEGLDPLLAEIDRRHAQYLRTSLRQVRYQLISADSSFKDRLVSLSRRLAALQAEGGVWLPGDMPGLQWQPVRAPDLRSFYTPPQRRPAFTPVALAAPALHPSELAALRLSALRDAVQALTPDKVNRTVLALLDGRRALPAAALPQALLDDLHWLTAIIAYGYHPEVAYGVQVAPGEPVAAGAYRVEPFELTIAEE
jgi:hypothetical protein